ncbi:hypothetical protein ABB37_09102 [Leptomonas pyrrhocoris]|uniref:Uncharacterized protein n=1 Tax=Leptomonas pyrrhocoris TaxID=157538 RepID=A0A0N0DRG2_LEPPY|nr:hypothetical protein ABB37_09102 [Leptomonas pyrrhocoris]KPA74398.1 hypothetical protein ABB37_09102 [Leptomonas pyrrhocoris]|eukprot:XP_015652837.1 hypothetical protein ABB37_09102 [Leptomonas pyrrhocoris]
MMDMYITLATHGPLVPRSCIAEQPALVVLGPPRAAEMQSLPCAVPYHAADKGAPAKVGSLGNVVLTKPEELEPWLLVARPVGAKEAAKRGGCIVFAPPHTKKGKSSTKPHYCCLTDTDDEVYGRAAYVSLAGKSEGTTWAEPTHSSDGDTSCDGHTEDMDEAEGPDFPSKLPLRYHSIFLRCA